MLQKIKKKRSTLLTMQSDLSPLPVMTCPSSRLTHRVARMEGQVITGTYRAPVARALPVKEIQTLLAILGPC